MKDSDDVHAPKIKRYTYQEYPRMLYKSGGKNVIVQNEEQKNAALAKGWKLEPIQELPSSEDLDAVVAERETRHETAKRKSV